MNVLSPGQVDTPNSQRLDKETRQMFESLIPRGKMGRPEEIAAVALFLASDDSSYVNGAELSVDGSFFAIWNRLVPTCRQAFIDRLRRWPL